jgi:hypothetical protein
MSYFIFNKNSDNIENTIYKIAENQNDLTNLNINQSDYKIIEDSQSNFDLTKYGNIHPIKYINNAITFINMGERSEIKFDSKQTLQNYLNNFKNQIKQFTDNNPNHPLLDRWNNYYNQLSSLNLDNITFPLNKSLEKYFNDLGQPSINPLQLP